MSNPLETNHISENINMKELRGRSMNSSRNICVTIDASWMQHGYGQRVMMT